MDYLVRRCPLAVALLALACGAPMPKPKTTSTGETTTAIGGEADCIPQGDHVAFTVLIDGREVGWEVRTRYLALASRPKDSIYTSHRVERLRVGQGQVDTHTVRFERFGHDNQQLLRGSHVFKDQTKARVTEISAVGEKWQRNRFVLSTVNETLIDSDSVELNPHGADVIGLRIFDVLKDRLNGSCDQNQTLSYYEPKYDELSKITISCPKPGSIELHQQQITGDWVDVVYGANDHRVKVFFDDQGNIREEHHPIKNLVLRRIPGPVRQSDETTELIAGLQSETYLPNPNDATRAVYRLKSTPNRLKSLNLLEVASNQQFVSKSKSEYLLEVYAGAPEPDDSPVKDDLASTQYIKPENPDIQNAYLYLRSAGKRGTLAPVRKDNVVSVIARTGLIRRPKKFWADSNKVAGLMMEYVSALLPDKHHTFSMADAVATLSRGAGDCTEHAVLFAALMRAHKIPTRLVSGIYLTRGGMWGYHMWNSYWDGAEWHAIDPSTLTYRPGALYVALGSGVSRFVDVRNRLAEFMWKTFNGVSIDLIEAVDDGEHLYLARPRTRSQDTHEAAFISSNVLAKRGDYRGAIQIMDEKIPVERRSILLKIQYIELLTKAREYDRAIKKIRELRAQTSSVENSQLLDKLELKCALETQQQKIASQVYERLIQAIPPEDDVSNTLLEAQYSFGVGSQTAAVEALKIAIENSPKNAQLLSAYADYMVKKSAPLGTNELMTAIRSAEQAVEITGALDPNALHIMAKTLIAANQPIQAAWFVDQASILAPLDDGLQALRDQIDAFACGKNSN